MNYTIIENETELNTVIKKELGILLYFSRATCNVGEALEPKVIAMLEQEFPKIPFYFIDMDKTPAIAARFSVFVEPTILVLFEGKESIRKSRIISIGDLSTAIKRLYTLAFD